MRTILSCFLLVLLAVSCQVKEKETPINATVDSVTVNKKEDVYLIKDTVEATAIFWIDKKEMKAGQAKNYRTVKAKVLIHRDGRVELQSFVKQQSNDLEKYVRHHLDKFRVSEEIFKSRYVKPGEQFVQLRCLADNLKGK